MATKFSELLNLTFKIDTKTTKIDIPLNLFITFHRNIKIPNKNLIDFCNFVFKKKEIS